MGTRVKSTLKVLQFADFFNRDNNKRFTRQEWRRFVDRMERAQPGGQIPNNLQVAEKGDLIHRISRRIPAEARREVQKTTMVDTEDDTKIYIERGDTATPAVIDGPAEARLVRIDAVGKHHARMQTVRYRNYTVRKAVTWDDRWAAPNGSVKAWAAQTAFRFLGRDPIWLSELSRSDQRGHAKGMRGWLGGGSHKQAHTARLYSPYTQLVLVPQRVARSQDVRTSVKRLNLPCGSAEHAVSVSCVGAMCHVPH